MSAVASPTVRNGNAQAEAGTAQLLTGDQVVQYIFISEGWLVLADNSGDGLKNSFLADSQGTTDSAPRCQDLA